MKKLLFILLALPLLTTAQLVRVPYSCGAGNAFTIKIPVRIPVGASGEYEWYKNGTLIAGTRAALTAGAAVISYTIPADEAFGDSVVFHFKYSVYEDRCKDCAEWISSPQYVVAFLTCQPPQASEIAGSMGICANSTGSYSVEYAAGVSYAWSVPEGWTIAAGQGSHSVTVAAGTAVNGGNISVTPSSTCGVGATQTLAIAMNVTPAPSDIEGLATECANFPSVAYSVAQQQGVSYAWSVPAGWLITAGQYSHSITVRTGSASGAVSVTATASCGSATRTKPVSLVICPPPNCAEINTPGAVTVTYCVPNPGTVGIGYCVPNPGTVGVGYCVPNPGTVGIGYCVPNPGTVGIGYCVPNPGTIGISGVGL